jgi:hypothetical protein
LLISPVSPVAAAATALIFGASVLAAVVLMIRSVRQRRWPVPRLVLLIAMAIAAWRTLDMILRAWASV